MKTLYLFLALISITTYAADIIPVSVWPRVLNLADKQIINASVEDCVAAGYRLLPAEPATPAGKLVKTREVIQDPDKPEMAKIVVTYENLPTPPIPFAPEGVTNIVLGRISISFGTNSGVFKLIKWLDAPAAVTNL